MLKIWLTCLQPSLSILGVVLVLSNTISAYAASKNTGVLPNKVSKGQSQQKTAKPLAQPQKFGAKGAAIVTASTPTQGIRSSSSSSFASPDDAVRRLALDTIAKSESKTPTLTAKTSQPNNSGIASFISPSPSGFGSIAPKSTKVIATHHQNTPATPLVSGLFITNNSTGRLDPAVANFPNLAIPSRQQVLPVVAQLPTATMTTSAKVAAPVPVVQAERIKPLESTGAVVSQTALQSNPQPTTVANGLEQFLGNEPKSVLTETVPNTTIAKGLEQFLGNEPKSIQQDSMAPVAKAIPVKTDSILSLSELVSPTKAAQRNTSASSLQLATSNSYDNAAEFDLPGVETQLRTVKTAQAKVKVPALKKIETNLSTAVVQRKNDYVALMSDKPLKSQQQWMTVRQGNSLGGLILGTRSTTNEIASLPINVLKASSGNSLGLFDPSNQY